MTQPHDGVVADDEVIFPGSPRWYLSRLTQRLLSRQTRYDKLERYASGNHPLPNGDKRYVAALRDLQIKCRTNYCQLVSSAVTERMRVIGFQFGPESQVDEDAEKIWNYNDFDYQSIMLHQTAANFGDAYVLVSPAIEDDGEPVLSVEDPRMCITEGDPRLPTKLLAGLKMWQEDATAKIFAVLYLPDQIRLYEGPAVTDVVGTDTASLTTMLVGRSAAAGGYRLIEVQPNPLGEIPLVRYNWQPAFGTMGRAEFEGVIDIQDRINLTMLDRLIIARNQAYNQRWMTGATKGDKFDPGADRVWATIRPDAQFGQFEAVDLDGVLRSIENDVGHLAAVSKTPSTYLMNRMVNVSGDTLAQDQAALVSKVRLREESMGWSHERVMRLAFKTKGDTAKAKETNVVTLWKNPEIHDIVGIGDLFSKLTGGGVPLDIAMKVTGIFTDDQIESAKEQAEEMLAQEQEMAMEMADKETEGQIAVEKNKPKPAGPAKKRPSGKGS